MIKLKQSAKSSETRWTLKWSKQMTISNLSRSSSQCLTQSFKNEISELQVRMDAVESQPTPVSPFDPEVSVIFTGLRYHDGEDILARAKELIANGLGESTLVMNAMRTPFRQGKPGIVKIQFSNTDDKIRVLRAKMKLAKDSDYKKVFIRSSQSHAKRLLHNNTVTILQEMGVEQTFLFTGSGRLVPRQEMTPKVPDGAPSVTNLVTYNETQRTYPSQNTHQIPPPFHGGMYPASQGWVTTPNNHFPQNLQGGNSGPVTGHPSI